MFCTVGSAAMLDWRTRSCARARSFGRADFRGSSPAAPGGGTAASAPVVVAVAAAAASAAAASSIWRCSSSSASAWRACSRFRFSSSFLRRYSAMRSSLAFCLRFFFSLAGVAVFSGVGEAVAVGVEVPGAAEGRDHHRCREVRRPAAVAQPPVGESPRLRGAAVGDRSSQRKRAASGRPFLLRSSPLSEWRRT